MDADKQCGWNDRMEYEIKLALIEDAIKKVKTWNGHIEMFAPKGVAYALEVHEKRCIESRAQAMDAYEAARKFELNYNDSGRADVLLERFNREHITLTAYVASHQTQKAGATA